MDGTVARKTNPAGQAARSAERLIEAAETLYGKHGLEGVSLRQIGLAAGSGNNFAVQYHFGDAAGLVRGILAKRMPEVDARQTAMLAAMRLDGTQADTRALVEVFFRPLLEPRNKAGERSYARFIVALLNSSSGMRHCRDLFHLTPTSESVLDRLCAINAHVPHAVLRERLRLMSIMVCTSVFNRPGRTADDAHDPRQIEDALDMAAAGVAAPFPRRVPEAVPDGIVAPVEGVPS